MLLFLKKMWTSEHRASALLNSVYRSSKKRMFDDYVQVSDLWNIERVYEAQLTERPSRKPSGSHVTVTEDGRILRGILRGVLSKVENWGLFRECIQEIIVAKLRESGMQEDSRQFKRRLNQKQAFGTADTTSIKVGGEMVGDRWAMTFQDCSLSDRECAKAWLVVQTHIEESLLPSLSSLRENLLEKKEKKIFFQDMELESNDKYTCIRKGVLIDPINSSKQSLHLDIFSKPLEGQVGSFNIWNIFIPIDVVKDHLETKIQSESAGGLMLPDLNATLDDVVFFDGRNWHFGQGNPKSVNHPRILIHLVYTQTKLLQTPLGREEISQQYQPGGLYKDSDGVARSLPADERSIFDPNTLVGRHVQADLKRLKIEATPWERAGGLGIDLGVKEMPKNYQDPSAWD